MKLTQFSMKKSQGLSLIEMMISMVLGLFLVGGLTTMYIGSKKTDKVRTAVSDIEENARMTLNSIRLAIEHAGYKSVNNVPLDKPFHTPSDNNITNAFCRDDEQMITNASLFAPPVGLTGFTKDEDANSTSDRVTVIYRADNPNVGPIYFDCNGERQAYDNGGIATNNQKNIRQTACSTDPDNGILNTWDSKIYNAIYVDTTDKKLRCLGSRSTRGASLIAENIENMQLRYGVMKTKSDDTRETIYKNASQVEVNNEWEAVTSIQVAILVSSEKEVLEQAESHEFDLLDKTISIDADRKLYRTFSTTIHLPNRSRRELQKVTRGAAEAT